MKFWCVFLSSFFLVHCSHTRWKATDAPIGDSKSSIVEALGGPQRSWRKEGKDYWYYNPQSKDPSEKVILIFENGVLVRKAQPGVAGDFDELEEELKKLKPKESQGFETLSE